MKQKHIIKQTFLLIFSSIIFYSCSSKNQIGSYYDYEITCDGSSYGGSQRLIVWGSGTSKSEAIEQAKKNALHTVLFKGVRKGQKGCQLNPIVTEVNAEQNYSEYFSYFFSNSSIYSQFVKVVKQNSKEMKQENSKEVKYGVIVDIDMNALKNNLINNNILQNN